MGDYAALMHRNKIVRVRIRGYFVHSTDAPQARCEEALAKSKKVPEGDSEGERADDGSKES